MKIFVKIRAYYVIFILLFLVGFMIPFVAVFRKFNSFLRFLTSKGILFFSGVKLEVIGNIDDNANILIINHQSMLDILAIEVATKKSNVAWVAKEELFKIKFFGLALSLSDNIALNRENRQGIIKLLKDVKDRIANNRVVAIFPEGTRNVENTFLPFKSGASIISNKLKLRVQPVVLVNSAKRFDVKNLISSSGKMQVIFLDSFDANKDSDWLENSKEKMYKVFLENLEK